MPLRVVDLAKRFGNKWVLRDISFDASGGRIFGICGATGSGKSVLLSTLAGEEKPSGGSIEISGREASAGRSKDRGITLISREDGHSIVDILKRSGRSGSTGERVFASFEQAISKASGVVLIDDVFSCLDHKLKVRCFDTLRSAAKERDLTVVFATSDFSQLTELADDAAILSKGMIVQTGTPQEIFEHPSCVAAAEVSGDHNLFAARRQTSSDAELPEFYTLEGEHRVFAQQTDKARLGSINQNVTLAIRPEQVTMSMGASFPEDNLLKAVVKEIRFLGPTSLIHFDANGLILRARVFKVVGLEPGAECMLGLPPHRISVLAD